MRSFPDGRLAVRARSFTQVQRLSSGPAADLHAVPDCVRRECRSIEKALADSSADPRQFRVLLFSFDSTETPSTLARYRMREKIPLGWSVGTASQTDIDALLGSIGFQYGKAGTEFSHPNLLIFLDSELRIAKGSTVRTTRITMLMWH